jgi:hypothetical protein
MAQHKFAIGQLVDFDTRMAPMPKPNGPYEIIRVLPSDDATSRAYRIKSKAEAFERSAKEYEIVASESGRQETTGSVLPRPNEVTRTPKTPTVDKLRFVARATSAG